MVGELQRFELGNDKPETVEAMFRICNDRGLIFFSLIYIFSLLLIVTVCKIFSQLNLKNKFY